MEYAGPEKLDSFSRASQTYEEYAKIQNFLADKVTDLLSCFVAGNPDQYPELLEIGTGPGTCTIKMHGILPQTRMLLIDQSAEMIDECRKKLQNTSSVRFLVKDAEDIPDPLFIDYQFDILISGSTVQWFRKPEKTLSYYSEMVRKDGLVILSGFTDRTFHELGTCIRECIPEARSFRLPAENFPSSLRIRRVLQKNFRILHAEEGSLICSYPNLKDFFREMRKTGVNGPYQDNLPLLTPGILRKMEKAFFQKYKNIQATYSFYLLAGERL